MEATIADGHARAVEDARIEFLETLAEYSDAEGAFAEARRRRDELETDPAADLDELAAVRRRWADAERVSTAARAAHQGAEARLAKARAREREAAQERARIAERVASLAHLPLVEDAP